MDQWTKTVGASECLWLEVGSDAAAEGLETDSDDEEDSMDGRR